MPNRFKYELRFVFNTDSDEEALMLMEKFSLAVMKEKEILTESGSSSVEVFRVCLKNEE